MRTNEGKPQLYGPQVSVRAGAVVVAPIERAISGLSREELSKFRAWLLKFDAEARDRQFEQDVAAGRLDALAEEALADLYAGRTRPL